MLRAVIFDMDGTLLDSVDYHARAWQDAFRDYGHDFEFGAIQREIGKGGDQFLPVFLSRDEISGKGAELEKHRGALLKERYLSSFAPFPQVRALFQRLSDDGIRIVLASSSKADELRLYRTIAGIDDLVDEDVSSEGSEASKPEPDISMPPSASSRTSTGPTSSSSATRRTMPRRRRRRASARSACRAAA